MKKIYFLFFVFFGLLNINAQVISNTDFESGLPSGWTLGNHWGVGNISSLGSQYFPFTGNTTKFAGVNDDDLGDGVTYTSRLTTDWIDFSNYPAILMSMDIYYYHENYNGAGQETFKILYSEDSTSWKILQNVITAYEWDKFNKIVSNELGGKKVKIAFEYYDGNNWSYGLGLDNIKFEVVPEYFFSVIYPEIPVKAIKTEDETSTFDFGFVPYGQTGIEKAALKYTIDGGQEMTVNFEGDVVSGAEHFISVPGIELGQHEIQSSFIFNDTFELQNENFTVGVYPPLPHFVGTDVDGNDRDVYVDAEAGKVILFDFFASWCGPCESSTPLINTVWDNHGRGANDFQVYSLSVEPNDDDEVVQSLGWGGEYPAFSYSTSTRLMYYIYNSQYGESAIPFFVLACPNKDNPAFSEITWTNVGTDATLGNKIETAITSCLGTSKTNDLILNDIKLYPNPAHDIINLSFISDEILNGEIYITDQTGRKVLEILSYDQFQSMRQTIDVSGLTSGMYLLNIISDKGNKVEKFVKQ